MDLGSPIVSGAIIAASAAIVAAVFAFVAAIINARIARKNAVLQATIAQRTKMAEFRQAWVNDLRDCFAKLHVALGAKNSIGPDDAEYGIRILLLMNRNDADYDRMRECIFSLTEKETNKEEREKVIRKFITISQDILKREWGVIKSDIGHFTDPL